MKNYFDYAATCPPIQESIDAYVDTVTKNGSINRSLQVSNTTELQIEKTRKKVNQIFNNNGITTFVSSATYAANLVVFSLIEQSSRNLNIWGSVLDHHSLSAPIVKSANQNKVDYQLIPLQKNFDFDYEKIEKLWQKNKPDILTLTLVNNVIGYKIKLLPIIKLFKQYNSEGIVVLDSSQYLGGIDLQEAQVDFCFYSTHKWYSVKGLGCLLISKKAATTFQPLFTGGGGIHKIIDKRIYLKNLIDQIEIGTINESVIIGFKAVLDKLDFQEIRLKNKEYAKYFIEQLEKIKKIEIYNKETENQVAFNLKGVHIHDLGNEIADKGFVVRAGNHCASLLMEHLKINGCVRVSFGIDTTTAKINKLIKQLKNIIKEMSSV